MFAINADYILQKRYILKNIGLFTVWFLVNVILCKMCDQLTEV